MSSPKEKALKLYSNYLGFLIKNSNLYIDNGFIEEQAKQCALIAVDEIIKSIRWSSDFNNEQKKYWQEVKQEIEKL